MTDAARKTTRATGCSKTLPCEPQSVRRARLFVAGTLSAWGLGDLTGPSTLIVSELVTNVIDHTRCRLVRVAVRRTAENRVRVTVADKSRTTPRPKQVRDESEEGRGLLLVDALSHRWGYEQCRSGKVVWAELHTKRDECQQ